MEIFWGARRAQLRNWLSVACINGTRNRLCRYLPTNWHEAVCHQYGRNHCDDGPTTVDLEHNSESRRNHGLKLSLSVGNRRRDAIIDRSYRRNFALKIDLHTGGSGSTRVLSENDRPHPLLGCHGECRAPRYCNTTVTTRTARLDLCREVGAESRSPVAAIDHLDDSRSPWLKRLPLGPERALEAAPERFPQRPPSRDVSPDLQSGIFALRRAFSA